MPELLVRLPKLKASLQISISLHVQIQAFLSVFKMKNQLLFL